MTSLVGIPGTISPEAARIRWIRQPDVEVSLPSGKLIGQGREYRADVADGSLRVLVSQDEVRHGVKLWHVSVSHRDREGRPGRLPSWDELKQAAYRLVPVDVVLVLIFPRRSTPYVNLADALHLWESEDQTLDT